MDPSIPPENSNAESPPDTPEMQQQQQLDASSELQEFRLDLNDDTTISSSMIAMNSTGDAGDGAVNTIAGDGNDDSNTITTTTTTRNHAIKRWWGRAATVPVLKHFVMFLQTYGTLFLFNHAYRSLFFMNLISGIGNFFSEIAIISLIEGTYQHNSTITNSTLSNSTNLLNRTRTNFDFAFHSNSFFTKLLLTRNDAIYKITQEFDVPSTAQSEASGSEVSGIFISLLLPAVILMPITGIVADLFDRRKILLISDILRGFIVLLFLVAYFVGVEQVQWLVYLTIVLQYSCGSFFEPSREALVPLVVKQEDLPIANALDSLCWLAVSFLGSSVGGIVVSLFGVVVNFGFDSFSFFLSGFFCILLFQYKHLGISGIEERKRQELKAEMEIQRNELLESPNQEPGNLIVHSSEANLEDENLNQKKLKKEEKKNMLEEDQSSTSIIDSKIPSQNLFVLFLKTVKNHLVELMRGVVFFSKNPLIFTSTIVKGSGAFFWFSCELILIRLSYGLFAGDNRKMGGLYMGIAKCFSGLGSGLAPVILERLLPKKYSTRTLRGILTCASFGFPICFTFYYFSILLANDPSTRNLGFAGVCLSSLILGISGGTLWSFSITHLQMVCPNDYLGRAFAIDLGFFLNMAGITSMILYGSILDDILKFEPAHMALFELGSSLVLCALFVIWFFVFRKNVVTREAHLASSTEKQDEMVSTNDQI